MVVESHDDLRHKNLFYIKTLYIYNVFSYPRIILTRRIIATESTEEHEKITINAFIFPCSSVDSVAIKKIGTQHCEDYYGADHIRE